MLLSERAYIQGRPFTFLSEENTLALPSHPLCISCPFYELRNTSCQALFSEVLLPGISMRIKILMSVFYGGHCKIFVCRIYSLALVARFVPTCIAQAAMT